MTVRGALFSFIVATVLSGCHNFKSQVAKSAVDYDKAVEKARNELLFLNVIRAKERHPMIFTAFSQIRGSFTSEIGAGGDLTFGPGTSDAYTLSASGKVSSNPSFDLVVLDSREFQYGLMHPVSMTILRYYSDMRWPMDLLLYLMVDKIEILEESRVSRTIVNSPSDSTFSDFKIVVTSASPTGWSFESVSETTPIGPVLEKEALKDLEKLVEVHAHELELQPQDSDANEGDAKCYRLQSHKELVVIRGSLKLPDDEQSGDYLMATPGCDLGECELNADQKEKKTARVYLRSPEAILYYLGELMRSREPSPTVRSPGIDGEKPTRRSLFVARPRKRQDENVGVAVEYRGVDYVIPGGEASGQSMHCLSLISQLLSLHKKSKDLPTTQAVTVVGR